MVEIWFAILTFMLTMFVVLDGWDIGAGALHLVVAKTHAERREVVAAIGPLWSWHEVWLVASGGVLFVAFPEVMASAFSGFYLALFMLLWVLLLRGISIEVGGNIGDPLWQAAWDFGFAAANVVLAILLGAALGNVIRGVPLDASGWFSLPLFGDFGVRGRVGILDWYTISVAVFTLVTLAAHGATYLVLRTEGPVHDRSDRLARRLWVASLVLLVGVTVETIDVRPELFGAIAHRPIAWIGVGAVVAGALAIVTGLTGRREARAFAGSCAAVAGLLAALAAGLFPVMLHSTLDPARSLTAYAGASAAHSLAVALVWWPIAAVLAFIYLAIVARTYRGKVRPAEDTQGFY